MCVAACRLQHQIPGPAFACRQTGAPGRRGSGLGSSYDHWTVQQQTVASKVERLVERAIAFAVHEHDDGLAVARLAWLARDDHAALEEAGGGRAYLRR